MVGEGDRGGTSSIPRQGTRRERKRMSHHAEKEVAAMPEKAGQRNS